MTSNTLILLVDDDADLLDVHRAVLEANGYRVETAHNGQECLEKARRLRPAAIVLDVMMEYKTEGFHVAYDLRQDPDTGAIPIVMLTGINRDEFVGRFQPDPSWLPVDRFLDKPLAPERLLEEVRRVAPG
jgi:CheY-like chemotaxis protein